MKMRVMIVRDLHHLVEAIRDVRQVCFQMLVTRSWKISASSEMRTRLS